MKSFMIAAATLAALPGAAWAADNTVSTTSQTVTLGGTSFNSYDGTLTNENTGGGATAINANRAGTAGGAGDTGSLEVKGDRSRYVIGSLYNYANAPGFALSGLRDMSWDWNVDVNGSGQPHAAPVARFTVVDLYNVRAELTWEYSEGNGGVSGTNAPTDQWLAAAGGKWYANFRSGGSAGFYALSAQNASYTLSDGQTGRVYLNGSQVLNPLSAWNSFFSSSARVIGVSFGAGSGFGSNFTGYVDNVALTTAAGTDRINFEPAATAAVPEPASWAMMIGGFALVGGAARRRSTRVRFA